MNTIKDNKDKNEKKVTSDTMTNFEYYLIYIVVGIVIFLVGSLLFKLSFVKSAKEPNTMFAFLFFTGGMIVLSLIFYFLTAYLIPFLNY
jgi:H+/Cl- antiporter ClcA